MFSFLSPEIFRMSGPNQICGTLQQAFPVLPSYAILKDKKLQSLTFQPQVIRFCMTETATSFLAEVSLLPGGMLVTIRGPIWFWPALIAAMVEVRLPRYSGVL